MNVTSIKGKLKSFYPQTFQDAIHYLDLKQEMTKVINPGTD